MKDLNTLSKEELVVLAEKQQTELKSLNTYVEYYRKENEKLTKKIATLKNVIDL